MNVCMHASLHVCVCIHACVYARIYVEYGCSCIQAHVTGIHTYFMAASNAFTFHSRSFCSPPGRLRGKCRCLFCTERLKLDIIRALPATVLQQMVVQAVQVRAVLQKAWPRVANSR